MDVGCSRFCSQGRGISSLSLLRQIADRSPDNSSSLLSIVTVQNLDMNYCGPPKDILIIFIHHTGRTIYFLKLRGFGRATPHVVCLSLGLYRCILRLPRLTGWVAHNAVDWIFSTIKLILTADFTVKYRSVSINALARRPWRLHICSVAATIISSTLHLPDVGERKWRPGSNSRSARNHDVRRTTRRVCRRRIIAYDSVIKRRAWQPRRFVFAFQLLLTFALLVYLLFWWTCPLAK